MNLKKILLIFILISLSIFTFVLGVNYQKTIFRGISPTPTKRVVCTLEAKICPDGSTVSRVEPNCEFKPCPDISSNNKMFCGGFASIQCPEGYTCQLEDDYPDAGGTCVKTENLSKYECPASNYVDCMPGFVKSKSECNPQFIQWAKANCPGFEVVY